MRDERLGWTGWVFACCLGITAAFASELPRAGATDQAGVAAFHAESAAAMDAMMKGMQAPSTGDVDHDFVAMMVPHHQGAIDMAVAELSHGHDEQLRRIAQEIIVDQQQEIAAMHLALHQPLPAATPAPTTVVNGSRAHASEVSP